MRLIDADALMRSMKSALDSENPSMWSGVSDAKTGFRFAMDFVCTAPTLSPDEVRGVVWCKDCTFGESATDGDGNPCVLCGNSMVFDYPYAHDPDWFCADGEMKGADDGTTDMER